MDISPHRKTVIVIEGRFWAKVNKTEGCWNWTGARGGLYNYGHFWMGYDRGVQQAHRVSWFISYGEFPQQCVLHKCDNVICVRIEHLFLGTRTDNARDRDLKERQVKGEDHGMVKLSIEEVKEIRLRYTEEKVYYWELADIYGVSPSQIGRIVRGKRWSHASS